MNHVSPLISSVQCSHQHYSQLKHCQIQKRNKESWHSKSECKSFWFFSLMSHIKHLKIQSASWWPQGNPAWLVSKGKQARFAIHPKAFSWNVAGRKGGQVWDQNNHKCYQAASLTCLQSERSTWEKVKKGLLDTHSAWYHCTSASKDSSESPEDLENIKEEHPQHNRRVVLTKLFKNHTNKNFQAITTFDFSEKGKDKPTKKLTYQIQTTNTTQH